MLTTTRWTPIFPASIQRLRREFDDNLQSAVRRDHLAAQPPLTIWEDETNIYVEADVPGFREDALEIQFKDGQLSLSGNRPVPKDDGNYSHNERMFGEFRRVIMLSDVVDPNSIDAVLENGVLHICIGKKPEAQPTKISVKSARANGKTKRIADKKA